MTQTMFFGYYFGKLSVAVTNGDRPEKGDWNEIDVASLTPAMQDMYQEYKDAYAMMKDAKKGFEDAMRREAGFRTTPKAVKATPKRGLTLADFVAMQKANGASY